MPESGRPILFLAGDPDDASGVKMLLDHFCSHRLRDAGRCCACSSAAGLNTLEENVGFCLSLIDEGSHEAEGCTVPSLPSLYPKMFES